MKPLQMVVVCMLALFVFTGCNQPPVKETTTHLSTTNSHFSSGVNASVEYVTDGEVTFIVLNVDNQTGRGIEVWIDQTYKMVGAETSRKRRILSTNKKLFDQTIKAAKLEEGVVEQVSFEFYDQKGKLLFKTEVIENANVPQHGVKESQWDEQSPK